MATRRFRRKANRIGPCESRGAAECVRRSEAIRGSHDDGVPPPSSCGYAHRADLQHVRAADALERWPGAAEFCLPGAERAADYGVWRWEADAELLLRVRSD